MRPPGDRAPGWTMAQLGDFAGDGRTDIARIVNLGGEDHLQLLERHDEYSELLNQVSDEASRFP